MEYSIVATINKLNRRGNAGVVAGTLGQTDWTFGVLDTMQDCKHSYNHPHRLQSVVISEL